jgi:hypothetical protein
MLDEALHGLEHFGVSESAADPVHGVESRSLEPFGDIRFF